MSMRHERPKNAFLQCRVSLFSRRGFSAFRGVAVNENFDRHRGRGHQAHAQGAHCPTTWQGRIDREAHSLAQLERSKAATVHGDGSAARKGWLNCVAIENRQATIRKEIRAVRVLTWHRPDPCRSLTQTFLPTRFSPPGPENTDSLARRGTGRRRMPRGSTVHRWRR